jgi:rhodanese-related sulfurtransferase
MSASDLDIATPEALQQFVQAVGSNLLVVDVRDATGEDVSSVERTPLPDGATTRPQAINLVWDRTTNSMPLPSVDKTTPIITHCAAGKRGKMAKDYLESHGFANVLNGGGPKETACWNVFGNK